MTEATQSRLPSHLRRYVVDQNYDRYTHEDQAVWRYIMRQLKNFLSSHAHSSYLDGLVKTGITVERIPSIESIDKHLEKFGWGAVPVSGFIPPVAFIEFQSLGILPIASDMRTLEHLTYTPAPDIVHEAAGHAPILAHTDYAKYIRRYGSVARFAIISREDLDQYEAIRILSDIKEDPNSTPEVVTRANQRLKEVTEKMQHVSEATLLSRMGWWTTEYGLVGGLQSPKIFGAGLLSSVGESRSCFDSKVKKIPLSIDCINFSYDITEPQPQLFVAHDFSQLGDVLDQLAGQLSFKIGGEEGLKRAIAADNVNTVQLSSGIQISGHLKNYLKDQMGEPSYLQFQGACQLSTEQKEIAGHDVARHPTGFSCPVGLLHGQNRDLKNFSDSDLTAIGIKIGARTRLQFQSGVVVEGQVKNWLRDKNELLLITFVECRVTQGAQVLFDPTWGEYDMAVGAQVTAVFGGPADRLAFGETADFVASRIPPRIFNKTQTARFELFRRMRELREKSGSKTQFEKAKEDFVQGKSTDWLLGVELLELTYLIEGASDDRQAIKARLATLASVADRAAQSCIQDGISLADQKI